MNPIREMVKGWRARGIPGLRRGKRSAGGRAARRLRPVARAGAGRRKTACVEGRAWS